MDLHIQITDENGDDAIEPINVYQDGSDSEGALKIASMIEAEFNPINLKRAAGTRYGVAYDVPKWEQICRTLREGGEGQYADDIEAKIKNMQHCEAAECVLLRGHSDICIDSEGNDLNGDDHFDAKGNQHTPFEHQIPVVDPEDR